MTETATIYYHQPRIRKTNLRKEMLDKTEYSLLRLTMESAVGEPLRTRTPDPDFTSKRSLPAPEAECTVPFSSIFNCCVSTLRSLGLTGKYDGFAYICRAVEEILKSKDNPHFQNIYHDIGKEYGVNKSSVERSIRYSIGYIKRTGNRKNLVTVFGEALDDDKIFSNSKFLTIIAADVFEKLCTLEPVK